MKREGSPRFISSALRGIRSLVFPPRCPLCGLEDVEACDECLSSWCIAPSIRVVDSIPIFSPVAYDARARSILLGAKEHGERISRRFIVDAISSVIARLERDSELALVPIPSSKRAVRRRGEDFISRVVEEVVRSDVRRLHHLPILEFKYQVDDQSELSMLRRKINLEGSLRVSVTSQSSYQLRLPRVIIDDVITTGSTMRAALTASRSFELGRTIAGVTACRSDFS